MIVRQIVPERGDVPLESVLADLGQAPAPVAPFTTDVISFFDDLSRRLTTEPTTSKFPDVRALAFWMRRSHLLELRDQFARLTGRGEVRLPRGTVFHLPPGNVDTIFMYSWLLSALCGNRNLIRLPTSRTDSVTAMCDVLGDLLRVSPFSPSIPAIAIIGYAHDAEITAAVSAQADVRVIWGGDATVTGIREIPLPPRSIELTFADRYSIAAIDAAAYLDAGQRRQERLVDDFVSDTYVFGQGACSSPQLVAWTGPAGTVEKASEEFYMRVSNAAARRGYAVDAAVATAQTYASATLAADGVAQRCRRYGRTLMVAEMDDPADLTRTHVGGGFLLSARLGSLVEIASLLGKSDQTLTYFGFEEQALREVAERSAASGALDRIVPIGQALAFDRFWDGYDLLSSFTRVVRVAFEPARA